MSRPYRLSSEVTHAMVHYVKAIKTTRGPSSLHGTDPAQFHKCLVHRIFPSRKLLLMYAYTYSGQ